MFCIFFGKREKDLSFLKRINKKYLNKLVLVNDIYFDGKKYYNLRVFTRRGYEVLILKTKNKHDVYKVIKYLNPVKLNEEVIYDYNKIRKISFYSF